MIMKKNVVIEQFTKTTQNVVHLEVFRTITIKNVVIEFRTIMKKNVVKNEYEYEKLSEMNVCLVHLQKLKICQIIQIIVLKMSVIVIQTKFIQMMNDWKNVVIDECLSQILRIRAKRFV